MMRKLWNDEVGAVVSAELVLVLTILVIGLITGLTSLRDAIITELADVGQAIANVDQSYSFSGALSHSSSTASSAFIDVPDFCDNATSVAGARCLVVNGGVFAQAFEGTEQVGQ